jgi:hypothetical protein
LPLQVILPKGQPCAQQDIVRFYFQSQAALDKSESLMYNKKRRTKMNPTTTKIFVLCAALVVGALAAGCGGVRRVNPCACH